MTDSAYIIQIQLGDSEEIQQLFARNKSELAMVVQALPEEDTISAVQSLGVVDLASDYLTPADDEDLNFGQEK